MKISNDLSLSPLKKDVHAALKHWHAADDPSKPSLALVAAQELGPIQAQAHYQLSNAYLGKKAHAAARRHGATALRLLLPRPSAMLASLFTSYWSN